MEAHYQFLIWLMPTVEKFPRSHKFTIGDRIEVAALDVLEALIEATYTRDRLQHLRQANLGIEKLRFLLRTRGRPETARPAPLRACGARARRDGTPDRRVDEGASHIEQQDDSQRRCHDGMTNCSLGLPTSRHCTRAARRAVKGKRKKPGAASFFANLERELLALERQLRDGDYRPGRYAAFEVNDPKRRIVSAAPFRDRVVHHALCTVVEPIFEVGFIDHTFANRVGKGTHRAIEAYERYRDRYDHVLRCDIYRYFPAIDHAILKSDFRRRVSCPSTLALLDLIVDGSNPQEPVHLYFDGDDLFSPFRRRRGLPIGNLTSQFFANLYLDRFDHFATEVLRAPYVRYVDDFALFHEDPIVLATMSLANPLYDDRAEGQIVGQADDQLAWWRTQSPSNPSQLPIPC